MVNMNVIKNCRLLRRRRLQQLAGQPGWKQPVGPELCLGSGWWRWWRDRVMEPGRCLGPGWRRAAAAAVQPNRLLGKPATATAAVPGPAATGPVAAPAAAATAPAGGAKAAPVLQGQGARPERGVAAGQADRRRQLGSLHLGPRLPDSLHVPENHAGLQTAPVQELVPLHFLPVHDLDQLLQLHHGLDDHRHWYVADEISIFT